MSHILALIDGSTYTESVCDHAAWVSRGSGMPISVMHVLGRREVGGLPLAVSASGVIDSRDASLKELAQHDAERARMAQGQGRKVLDAAKARLEQDGVADIRLDLRHGDFVEMFEEAAVTAAVGVLGKRGEAADFARGHLGSNLERAVRASPIPLLVASRAFRPIHRVVVAFDGGPSAVKAVNHLAASALFDDCAVTLLTVGLPSSDLLRTREHALGTLVAHGHSPEAHELGGDPAAAIAEHVEDGGADLLVMGAYGHSRIRSMVIGSTTSEMLRACRVPVMLFR